jgi:hypothetical protein
MIPLTYDDLYIIILMHIHFNKFYNLKVGLNIILIARKFQMYLLLIYILLKFLKFCI